MLTYGNLDLKHLREVCDIDFAHFTYKKHQCSCCFGPKDLPARYWRNHTIPEGDDYSFILFKNAENGSGTVTKNDEIRNNCCIEWSLTEEQLDKVCNELQRQVDGYFIVIKPKDKYTCIQLRIVGGK